MKQGVPHYITPSAMKWHTFSMKPYDADVERKMLDIALQSNSSYIFEMATNNNTKHIFM